MYANECVRHWAQEDALASLLHSLARHPKLQTLWAHTGGVPQVLGQLAFDSGSQLPMLLSPGDSGLAAPSAIQLILFDAPAASAGSSGAAARFFSTSNPFDAAGQVVVLEGADAEVAGPLGLALQGAATSASPLKPSELEQALRRVNACRVTEAIVQYFVKRSSHNTAALAKCIPTTAAATTSIPSHRVKRLQVDAAPSSGALLHLSPSASVIPADFDFASVLSPPPSAFLAVLLAPFYSLASTLSALFFMLCERVLLPLLELRVLSLSRLVSSVFSAGMHRRLRVQSVGLWEASHGLGALHAKLTQSMRARTLNRAIAAHHQALLGVPTTPSVRAQEELWGGLASHAVEARLGILAALSILALMGWFDGMQLPQPIQDWMPPSSLALDSAVLRRSLFVVPAPIAALGSYLAESLESLLSSSAPAGLKLNHRLHAQLGRLLRQGLMDQSVLLQGALEALGSSSVALGILRFGMAGLALLVASAGFSVLLGFMLDVVWVASIPLVMVHATLARTSAFTCSIFRSLLLLFRGQKRNVLRGGRLDAFPMGANYEHVLLGTLGLACVTFLAPTIFLWHALAILARILGAEVPRVLLWTARAALHCAPWNLAWIWTRDRIDDAVVNNTWLGRHSKSGGQRMPAGIWFEVLPTSSSPLNHANVTCLLLHSSAAPASTLLFRARVWMRAVLLQHPPARVLSQIVWGDDRTSHPA